LIPEGLNFKSFKAATKFDSLIDQIAGKNALLISHDNVDNLLCLLPSLKNTWRCSCMKDCWTRAKTLVAAIVQLITLFT